MDKTCELLATDFYLGKLPYKFTGKYYGGGTLGTFAGFLLAMAMPANERFFIFSIVLLTLISVFVSHRTSLFYKTGDDQRIIIDETAGYMLSVAFLPRDLNYLIVAFVFFRIYDGLKPWPIKWLDKNLKGGLGITADDLVAGLFANVTLRIFMH